jgi:hypothetical protein
LKGTRAIKELNESDEQAQAEIASDLSEALDDTLHDHTDKLEKLTEPSNAAIELRKSLSSSARKTVASSDTARTRTAWADGSVTHCVYSGGPKGAYCWPTSPDSWWSRLGCDRPAENPQN